MFLFLFLVEPFCKVLGDLLVERVVMVFGEALDAEGVRVVVVRNKLKVERAFVNVQVFPFVAILVGVSAMKFQDSVVGGCSLNRGQMKLFFEGNTLN